MGSLPELAPQEMRLFSGWPETSSLGGQCPHRGRVSRAAGTAASEGMRGWAWQSLQGGGSFCLTSPPCRDQVHVPSVLWAIVPHLHMRRLDSRLLMTLLALTWWHPRMPELSSTAELKMIPNVRTESNTLTVSIGQKSGCSISGFSAQGLTRLRASCGLGCAPLWRLRVMWVVSKVRVLVATSLRDPFPPGSSLEDTLNS